MKKEDTEKAITILAIFALIYIVFYGAPGTGAIIDAKIPEVGKICWDEDADASGVCLPFWKSFTPDIKWGHGRKIWCETATCGVAREKWSDKIAYMPLWINQRGNCNPNEPYYTYIHKNTTIENGGSQVFVQEKLTPAYYFYTGDYRFHLYGDIPSTARIELYNREDDKVGAFTQSKDHWILDKDDGPEVYCWGKRDGEGYGVDDFEVDEKCIKTTHVTLKVVSGGPVTVEYLVSEPEKVRVHYRCTNTGERDERTGDLLYEDTCRPDPPNQGANQACSVTPPKTTTTSTSSSSTTTTSSSTSTVMESTSTSPVEETTTTLPVEESKSSYTLGDIFLFLVGVAVTYLIYSKVVWRRKT